MGTAAPHFTECHQRQKLAHFSNDKCVPAHIIQMNFVHALRAKKRPKIDILQIALFLAESTRNGPATRIFGLELKKRPN